MFHDRQGGCLAHRVMTGGTRQTGPTVTLTRRGCKTAWSKHSWAKGKGSQGPSKKGPLLLPYQMTNLTG